MRRSQKELIGFGFKVLFRRVNRNSFEIVLTLENRSGLRVFFHVDHVKIAEDFQNTRQTGLSLSTGVVELALLEF
jgi:hypothetical protein